MSLSLHTLKPAKGSTQTRRRVGRGGKRGTTSGKGTKGQRARSSGRKRLAMKGLRKTLMAIPKQGGFRSRYPKVATVTLEDLEKRFQAGDVVTSKSLAAKRLIHDVEPYKVLSSGSLTKALTVKAAGASASAKIAIEKAGGKLEIIGGGKAKKTSNKHQR